MMAIEKRLQSDYRHVQVNDATLTYVERGNPDAAVSAIEDFLGAN